MTDHPILPFFQPQALTFRLDSHTMVSIASAPTMKQQSALIAKNKKGYSKIYTLRAKLCNCLFVCLLLLLYVCLSARLLVCMYVS
jgi:hypothetical protein